jgi:heme/copper-type cytochrome/quinol oxidase subunit 3
MIGSPPPRDSLIPVKIADLPLPGRFPADLPSGSGPVAPRSAKDERTLGGVRGSEIPTGSRTATVSVGMAIALGAIAMTFAALLLAYAIVRVQSPVWPPAHELSLVRGWTWTWLATATLAAVVGSAALYLARRRAQEKDAPSTSLLAITAAAGLAFVAVQLSAWSRLLAEGFRPSSGLLASVVYALTLFHAVHAFVGVILLLPLIIRRARLQPIRLATLNAVSSFWHLVTLAWLVVAITVFVA